MFKNWENPVANVSPTRFGKSFGARLRGLKSFGRNEDGSLIVFSLFIFLVMLMVGGIAVDVIYLETQRTRMQYTLDRAILAAASLEQDLDPEFVVRDYFEKSGLTGFDIDIQHKTVESAGMRNYRWVQASTSLEIDTTFMRLAGVNHLSSPAFGSAEEGISDVEISLVVDVSGSMRYNSASGHTKLYELQKAAKEFGYAMLCNPSDPEREKECTVEDGRVSLSIVPYAAQVDVGADLAEQYGVFSDHTYSRCVDFSSDDFEATSVSLGGDLLQSAHFDYWSNSSNTPNYFYCDTIGSNREIQPLLSNYSDVDTFINGLEADKSTSIDQGMKWGVALLDPAAQPAIKAISEKANPNIDPLFAERPLPFGDGINIRDSSKVIVLMTDGKHEGRPFMNADKRRGPTPVYQDITSQDERLFIDYGGRYKEIATGNWVNSPGTYEHMGEEEEECTWYKYRGQWYKKDCRMVPVKSFVEADMDDEDTVNIIKRITWPELFAMKTEAWIDNYDPLYYDPTSGLNSGITPTTQDNNLFASCDAAKKEKILIFTIGFEVEDAYLDVMRDCASTENHFFDVDGTNISAAFAAIASQINRLRLTQ